MGARLVPACWLVLLVLAGAADAQTASLVLYGRINLDVEAVRGGDAGWTTRLSSNSTRFGLRGSESLGGGHEAFFQIESSVSADAGGGSIAGRDTYVGVRGAWGGVRAGFFKTPYDAVNGVFGNAPTFVSSILDTESVWGNGSNIASGGFPYRAQNAIRYDLPGIYLKGINGGVQVATNETGNDSWMLSAGGVWSPGPWQVGGVYQYNNSLRGAGLNDSAYSLALAYRWDVVRLAGVWEQIRYDTPTGDLKRDFWGVSATLYAGPGEFYAFYGSASDGKGGAAAGERVGGLARGGDTAAAHYEISYTYPLSKRTAVYAGYVKIDNDGNASYNFATNAVANLAPGGKPEGFVAGVKHDF
ncbi:MAG: porin [Betaproteobacteria bacterium]|nr:MAG: porin [Betaproteobacteria bacterium]